MRISELEDYKNKKPTKKRIEVGDKVIYIPTGEKYMIIQVMIALITAVNLETGFTWQCPIKLSPPFTKYDIEALLGSLDKWETVD